MAGTDEEEEFADMSEKELRFHKYAELKAQWEEANGRIVPASLSYLLHEHAGVWAGSHLAKRHGRTKPKKSGVLIKYLLGSNKLFLKECNYNLTLKASKHSRDCSPAKGSGGG